MRTSASAVRTWWRAAMRSRCRSSARAITRTPCARFARGRRYSAAIASERGGSAVIGQPRLVHLKEDSGMEPKCGAADATNLTNWVRGASFDEVYVPADIVGTTDLVCRKCQEEALRDDSGSDDEVVPDDEATATEPNLADAASTLRQGSGPPPVRTDGPGP